MTPLLREGLIALPRGVTTWQVGLDPARAVVLRGVGPRHARGLRALDRHHYPRSDPRDVDLLGPEVLRRLSALHLLAPGRPDRPTRAVPARDRARRAGEVAAARADGRVDPLVRRGRARVAVVGCGPVAALVATGLAAAGIGTVAVLGSRRPVVPADLTTAGPDSAELGQPWSDAVAAAVRRQGARTTVVTGVPQLAVLTQSAPVDLPWCDPEHGDEWLRRGIAHLTVTAVGAMADIGPLVDPGRTACLHCRELARADRDPGWPILTQGLRHLVRHRADPPPAVAAAVAGAAAGLAAAGVLARIDGATPTRSGGQLIGSPDGVVRTYDVQPHPTCGCRWGVEGLTMGA